MKKSLCSAALGFLFFLLPSSSSAQFYTLETENLRLIYYGQSHAYLVKHIARSFENALSFHRALFDYVPGDKVTVLLHDFSDYGNAGAGVTPENHITLAIAPLSYAFETAPANERMNATMNHEVVHLVAMDKAARRDNFFRSLFLGKVAATSDHPVSMLYSYLTTPRRYAPRWYQEGIAVFMETWMAGGLGRSLGGYDEMVFRTMVRDSLEFYDPVGLEAEGTAIDFQVGVNSYLYGTRFMGYLAYKYGPEDLIEWTNRTWDSKGYYAAAFRDLFGLSLGEAWEQWIGWERRFQQTNLEAIRQQAVTAYRPLSKEALGSVSRACYDPGERKLYAAVNYPGRVAHIAALDIDRGSAYKVVDIKGASLYTVASLACDFDRQTLFYTTDNTGWRDLRAVDLTEGTSRTLLKDARIGDLAFNPADRSLWGIRHYNGISTLVRLPYPYEEWNQIYSWPYGKDMYDIDVSPDGKHVTGALAEISGRQTLIKMSVEALLQGDHSHEMLFDFDVSNPANFSFSPDGRYLYGSSYYSGVSNLFRYELEEGKMEVISNCETGLFRPVSISADSLIAFRYSGKGFTPVVLADATVERVSAVRFLGQQVVETHPVVKKWLAETPASIEIDSLTRLTGKYSGLQHVRPVSIYPVVEGYKDYTALGLHLNLSGPIGLHSFALTASYSPSAGLPRDERLHLRFGYATGNVQISATYNAADFYDLFGPTKTSRKGYSVGLQYKKWLLLDEPRQLDYRIHIAGYGGLERLPDAQNITAPFDKLLSARGGLFYRNLRASLGAVDYEKGTQWSFTASGNYVDSRIYPRFYGTFDYGFPLPVDHFSMWLRTSFGQSFGDRDDAFANFFFGGFGNNWVDYQTVKRYREYYSFPGAGLNDLGGVNFGRVLTEWILPPLRLRDAGFSSFYLRWGRLSLFTAGLMTNLDSASNRRSVGSIGGQLDLRLIFFSTLSSTLSVGYALAVEQDEPIQKEFMISLKIL